MIAYTLAALQGGRWGILHAMRWNAALSIPIRIQTSMSVHEAVPLQSFLRILKSVACSQFERGSVVLTSGSTGSSESI